MVIMGNIDFGLSVVTLLASGVECRRTDDFCSNALGFGGRSMDNLLGDSLGGSLTWSSVDCSVRTTSFVLAG